MTQPDADVFRAGIPRGVWFAILAMLGLMSALLAWLAWNFDALGDRPQWIRYFLWLVAALCVYVIVRPGSRVAPTTYVADREGIQFYRVTTSGVQPNVKVPWSKIGAIQHTYRRAYYIDLHLDDGEIEAHFPERLSMAKLLNQSVRTPEDALRLHFSKAFTGAATAVPRLEALRPAA